MDCNALRMLYSTSVTMLPISDFAWTEQQFMQPVSTFAFAYLKDISAPLESIVIWDPMHGILKRMR